MCPVTVLVESGLIGPGNEKAYSILKKSCVFKHNLCTVLRGLANNRGKPREPKRSAHLLRVSNRAKHISTTSTMYYSPPTFLRLVLVQIQKNDGIRRRQSNVRTHAPIQGQLPPRHRRPVLGALGAGKSDAAVGVPVAYDVRPPRQRIRELGRRLPSVGAEQQVDGSIIRLDGGLEVFVDQSTHLRKFERGYSKFRS